MGFKVGKFYDFEDTGRHTCTGKYGSSYAFRPIDENFAITSREEGFIVEGSGYNHKEIFREVRPKHRDEMFVFAMKLISCGDVDSSLSGSESDAIRNRECEYKTFTALWEIPIEAERAWIDSEEFSDDEEDIMCDAISKMRMVKQYLAESIKCTFCETKGVDYLMSEGQPGCSCGKLDPNILHKETVEMMVNEYEPDPKRSQESRMFELLSELAASHELLREMVVDKR